VIGSLTSVIVRLVFWRVAVLGVVQGVREAVHLGAVVRIGGLGSWLVGSFVSYGGFHRGEDVLRIDSWLGGIVGNLVYFSE
jgi:hypothetical protein